MGCMRDYGKVAPSFWIGATGKALRGDAGAQLLALYLMTSPHANMIGVFHCPVLYMAHETGLPFEGASKALQRLIEAGFCTYEGESETVFVHRMAAFQVGESLSPKDNQVRGIQKDYEKMAPESIKQAFYAIYSEAFHLPGTEKKTSPLQAPCKPLASQEQEQEQEQEIGVKGGKPPASADAPPDGDAAAPPAKPNAGDKKIELPDWMPAEQWADFVAMRRQKGKRAPFTVAAAKGIVSDLGKLRERGQDVADVLHQSVVNGWSGVFPVNDARRAATPQNSAIGAFV